jgi:hypothetical protein
MIYRLLAKFNDDFGLFVFFSLLGSLRSGLFDGLHLPSGGFGPDASGSDRIRWCLDDRGDHEVL